MGIFDFFSKNREHQFNKVEFREKKESELMKSLCLGIVGDFGRLLDDAGFDKPVRTLEIIMFAMFIITETYELSKRGNKESESLNIFHHDMFNYFANEHLIKNMAVDKNAIFEFEDKFYDTVGKRYAEYRQHFKEDLNNPGTIYSNTLCAFMRYLFTEPISDNDKQKILIPMALKFVEFCTGSLKSFK